jgi:arabinofuranosyltransferase
MTDDLGERLDTARPAIRVGVVLVAAAVAWRIRFVQDDAFISFRFARNLADGHGLVFNPGERVEGYTNLLWTALMAVPEHLGWSTPTFSQVISLGLMAATLLLCERLAVQVLGDRRTALLALVVLAANASFLAYGTGGLETMLQTCLVTAVAVLLLRPPPPVPFAVRRLVARQALAGLLAGLAVLTRMDSAVLVAALLVVHLTRELRRLAPPSRPAAALRGASAFLAPVAVATAALLVWRWRYYGELLPNTFDAKSGSNPVYSVLFALAYILVFAVSYGYVALAPRVRRHWSGFRATPAGVALVAVVGVWTGYVVYVGADFMEFRFFVPVMPMIAVAVAYFLDRYRHRWRQVALIAVMLLLSAAHVRPGLAFPAYALPDLRAWPQESPESMQQLGVMLRETFPGGVDAPDQVVMATGTLGVLPYHSELPTIDMLGLADEYVADHGEPSAIYYPGHNRVAPVRYLVDRQVNLVSQIRALVEPDRDRTEYRLSELTEVYPVVDLADLPSGARALEVDVGERSWLMIYLTPHPAVDEQIRGGGWRSYPISSECRASDLGFTVRLLGTATCGT